MHRTPCVVLALVLAVPAAAGPLSPPAGPVGATHKTLSEIEPRIPISAATTPGEPGGLTPSLYKIIQPGSYYLTGNVQAEMGRHSIEIAAADVTVDLRGFTIVGTPGSLDGIRATAGARVTVRNGSVLGCGGSGVNLIAADQSAAEDIRAANNGLSGIVMGIESAVRRCTAAANGGSGITTDDWGIVQSCTASSNGGRGISASSASVVSDSVARDNTTDGFHVFFGSQLSRCAAYDNGRGIAAGGGCIISRCTSSESGGDGISVGYGTLVVETASVLSNGNGLSSVESGVRIHSSTFHGNEGHGVHVQTPDGVSELSVVGCNIRRNNFTGITSGASSSIADSTIASNDGAGVVLTSSCTITGCTVTSNGGSGIEAGNANVVQGNTVSSNTVGAVAGTAGVLVTGTDSMVDANRLFANTQGGIRVDSAGNMVVRNMLARTGATITAVTGNSIAQIIASPAAGFVSTDPNANYTY